jgi:hypothetical protein
MELLRSAVMQYEINYQRVIDSIVWSPLNTQWMRQTAMTRHQDSGHGGKIEDRGDTSRLVALDLLSTFGLRMQKESTPAERMIANFSAAAFMGLGPQGRNLPNPYATVWSHCESSAQRLQDLDDVPAKCKLVVESYRQFEVIAHKAIEELRKLRDDLATRHAATFE